MSADPFVHVRIGCAGWAVRKDRAGLYGPGDSHLARYAATFAAVEINSSFYKPHRRATYARWAAAVPPGFRFAVKLPRSITHEHRLEDCDDLLARFLDEVGGLGAKLGPLLVQLPPGFEFDPAVVPAFLGGLRARHAGAIACEPRHASWFDDRVEALCAELDVARVAADPAVVERAAEPGGSRALVYVRLHGSPIVYRSAYGEQRLAELAPRILACARAGRDTWVVFDNTAYGAAPVDALALRRILARAGG